MRRHTRNKLVLAVLLSIGVATWFLLNYVDNSADQMMNLIEMYDPFPHQDRWAAIKGGPVVQSLDDAIEGEEDNPEEVVFHAEAPPESKAFAEQKAVMEMVKEQPEAEAEPTAHASSEPEAKPKRKHPRRQHPKVAEDDETTVAVTMSTTEHWTTTDTHETAARMEEEHPVRSHVHEHEVHVAEHVHAQEHAPVAGRGHVQYHDHERAQGHVPEHARAHVHSDGHGHRTAKEHHVHGARAHELHRTTHRAPEHVHHVKNTDHEGQATAEDAETGIEWTSSEPSLPENDSITLEVADNVTELAEEQTGSAVYNQTVSRLFTLQNYTNASVPPASSSEAAAGSLPMGEMKPTDVQLQSRILERLPESPRRKSDRVNWEKFFSFIPNGLQSCRELFPNLDSQNPLPQDFQQAYIEFENVLRHFDVKDNNIAEHLEQFIVYYFLVRAPFVKTVCETGFGAGHSAFLWLQANPDVKVFMFDLGVHDYSGPIADYLAARFPGRLQVIWGDSVNTLPMFRQANKDVSCDVVVIDGGHTFRESFADYFHLRQMATANNIVLLDNYPDISRNYMEILGAVWEGGKRRGEINEIFHCDYRPEPHGFSVGRFIPYSMTLRERKR